MNPDLEKLQAYPFERQHSLFKGITPPADLRPVSLSIGEPRHAPPPQVIAALSAACQDLGTYPVTGGRVELRDACARWLERRYGLAARSVDADSMVLPLAGTREGLFAFAQSVVDRGHDAAVLLPNPFYQIYEGAALLAGAEAVYMNAVAENRFIPDLEAISEKVWNRCQLIYVCSPGNPTGAVLSDAYLTRLIELAHRHDFVIAADECYADIYRDESRPPPGLLQVSEQAGNERFRRCVVFHSLSKRCSVPGLRSGFVAGDPQVLSRFRLYRTYHGCAMPVHHQLASVAAWNDDEYARDNRDVYSQKFETAGRALTSVLDCELPEAAFYLWAATPIDEQLFAQRLYAECNLSVLPGSYLARETPTGNPGQGRVRLSLVASAEDCLEASVRITEFCRRL